MAPPIVIDTSIAAKWFFPEPDSKAADSVLDDCASGRSSLAAPDLIVYEFVNLLWKRVRKSEISGKQAREAMTAFTRLPISLSPADVLGDNALKIALETGCTAYDASFLALADYLGSNFLTADSKLVKLLAGTEQAGRARLIGRG